MNDSELDELHAEYLAEFIGKSIYRRITKIVKSLLSKRDPYIYARGSSSAEGSSDAIQDFVLEVLISEGQIDYVFTVAKSIGDFDRLVRFQARRYLARTRVRTVVDNLIDRALDFLRTSNDFDVSTIGDREYFSYRAEASLESPLGPRVGLNRAVALAGAVPKLASGGDQRAPAVYSAERLETVLRILFANSPGPVGISELEDFFSKLLTAWKPSFLGLDGGVEIADHSLLPEEETLVMNLAPSLAADMTPEERAIYAFKYANLPDRELAAHLGISRQSLSPRKQRLFDRLATELADVSPGVQVAVLERLAAVISDGRS